MAGHSGKDRDSDSDRGSGRRLFGAEIEEDVMGIIEKSYRWNGKLPILPLACAGQREEYIGLPDPRVIYDVYLPIY